MSSYSSIPKHLSTKNSKDNYCKFNYQERPSFNEELNMCAPSCEIDEILDPVTGDCSNLKLISEKYTELSRTRATFSFSILDYISFILNIVLISVLTYFINKKIKETTDIYYLKKYSYYTMLSSYWLILIFIFFSCKYRKIMSLLLTSIVSFSLFTAVKDK